MPNDYSDADYSDNGASSFDKFLAHYLAGDRARQTRSIDLSRFLTARTQEILQNAGRLALERGQTELDALHILRTIVEDATVAQAIERIGVTPQQIVDAVETRLPTPGARADADAATIMPSASRRLHPAAAATPLMQQRRHPTRACSTSTESTSPRGHAPANSTRDRTQR